MSTKRKRRYVKAKVVSATIQDGRLIISDDLVKDSSGVMVKANGGDLGANHEHRIARGDIVVNNRTATVKYPGRIEAITDGAYWERVNEPAPQDEEEDRKLLRDASHKFRYIVEMARLRKRSIALYQSAQDRSGGEMSDRQEAASVKVSDVAKAIGWEHVSALIDAITFEQPLSQKQEILVIVGLRKLADFFRLAS